MSNIDQLFGVETLQYLAVNVSELTPSQALSVPCPTCGAAIGEVCELHSGASRTEPHRDRKLTAADAIEAKLRKGKRLSLEADIQKMPDRTPAAGQPASPYEGTLVAEAQIPQFPYRVLVVDDEPSIREVARAILESQGYEVLTVADGLDGLNALSGSLPDVIISDLNMPRMSGFEFLAIVRKRFPRIATIAMSGEYIPSENTSGIVADAFLQKGHYKVEDLFKEVAKLLAASPIRSEREKSDIAPLYVPRDRAGYLIVTCPKCLRPNRLEAMSLNGGIHQTICQSCSTPVRFEINHEIEPLIKRKRA